MLNFRNGKHLAKGAIRETLIVTGSPREGEEFMKYWLTLALLFGAPAMAMMSKSKDDETKTEAKKTEMKDVVLIKKIGYLSENSPRNKKAECVVSRDHPELKSILANLDEMIKKAEKQPFQDMFHIQAQVPSVQIYAKLSGAGKEQDILLFEDHSKMKTRQGEEARRLIEMCDKLCPNP